MCILEEFIVNLQELLTGTKSYDNNIIRKHTRKLEQLGDISFPLNIKNWHNLVDNIRLQDRSVNSIFDCLSHTDLNMQIEELIEKSRTSHISIVRLSIKDDNVHLFLSRAIMLLRTIITEVLFNCEVYGSNEVIGKQINIEWNADVKSLELSEMDLSTFRLSILREVTTNLLRLTSKKKMDGNSKVVLSLSSVNQFEGLILCGPVLNTKGRRDNKTKAEELLSKRALDMRMMAQHKYGVQIQSNTSWKTYFEKLGRAAVVIEMLSNKPQKALKLSMNDLQTANKGAAFIFYNCARLAVLFKEFHKRVENNVYPKLPKLEEVDFSLLNQPEEWELFYVYILQFPITIKSCIKDIEKGIINPQYLVSFLSSLCSIFSAYYRRVRILTDPREHLYAVLYARIYLLKALQCVFHNTLHILNIDPIKEM